jgi:hypothetical protein
VFPKRPPHAHILLWLDEDYKPQNCIDYDGFVSAKIPNERTQPLLYKSVSSHMFRGTCGYLNPRCQSTEQATLQCNKKFRKQFTEETARNENGYLLYRHRNIGKTVQKCATARHDCVPLGNPKQFTEETARNENCYLLYRRRNIGKTVQKCATALHECVPLGNRWVVLYNRFFILPSFSEPQEMATPPCSTVSIQSVQGIILSLGSKPRHSIQPHKTVRRIHDLRPKIKLY